jgi:hypothetical protein
MRAEREPQDAPSLAFVVIVLRGGAALQRCLRGIATIPAQRLVVASHGQLREPLPGETRLIECDAPVPVRRAVGVSHAQADWVAVIEDTCEPAPTWYGAFLEAARSADSAAWGGPISIEGKLAPRYLALAAVEYGEFTPDRWQRPAHADHPAEHVRVARLAGLCLVYRRAALGALGPLERLIETETQLALRESGAFLGVHPGLQVTYFAADHDGARCSSRYRHGRIYGGGQRERLSLAARAWAIARSPALPIVLALRALPSLPSARTRWPAALWVFAFSLAWAAGECAGLLWGRGSSLEAWR